jgi:hypothetical protein
MRCAYKSTGNDAKFLAVAPNEHSRKGRFIACLKPFNLQVMFRMPKAGKTQVIRRFDVFTKLGQHSLVELRTEACFPGLQFLTAANCAVNK